MSSLQSPRSLWWKVHEFCAQLKVILCTGAFIVLFQWHQAEERKVVVTFGKYFWKNIYGGNCFSLLISVLFKKILEKDRLYRYTFWYTPLSFAEKALKKKTLYEPISCCWSLSMHPENIRRLDTFCYFQGAKVEITGMKWIKYLKYEE